MGPGEIFTALLILVGIPSIAAVAIARARARRPQSPAIDSTDRLEAVEQRVENLQRELAETQERLDFTERMLTKAREERRIGS